MLDDRQTTSAAWTLGDLLFRLARLAPEDVRAIQVIALDCFARRVDAERQRILDAGKDLPRRPPR